MRDRLRAWQEETHGCGFELLRHFIANFFETEVTSIPGEWQKVAAGIFAVLVSVSILVVNVYMERYDGMQQAGVAPARMYHEICSDQVSFIAIAMAITALLTVLEWQSLFPTLRDYLALAGLPLKPRQIFVAKAGALLLMFTGFVVALTGMPAVVFASILAGHWHFPGSVAAANAVSLAGSCIFIFFTLLACQGVLLNVLPARLFGRASLAVQGAVFVATLAGVPLIGRQPWEWWWPPMWFLRLWEAVANGRPLPAAGVAAIFVPVAAASLTYILSYHRYRRLLVEGDRPPAHDRESQSKSGAGARLFDRWIRNPREQAAFTFLWKTLRRSRTHRLILMAYAGLAVGWVTKGALDTPPPTLRNQGMYGLLVVLAPLTVAMLVTVGLRYLFSLPVTPRANWMFQTNDREGRAAWLGAVERFVVWCGIAPIFIVGVPAAVAILGPVRAVAATLLAGAAALLCFERLFRDWKKLPFTCTYLPGKRPAWLILTQALYTVPLLGLAGQLILFCSGELTGFAALFSFEAALWWRMRTARRKRWAETALLWEESAEEAVMTLELQPAEALVSTAPPAPETELFSDTLVASRGLLPRAWAEEIADERSHPAALAETFLEDVRYGLRLIRRSPLFSAVVVLTLTVGIGINASVFTVVSGLAMRPHVYKDPGSFLRIIPETRDRSTWRDVSYAEYTAWKERSRSVRQLAAWTNFPALIGADDAAGSLGMAVSCNFFLVDGLDRPTMGRLIDAQDCLNPGQMPVAVISESTWHNRLASDPHAIGRVIQVNNLPVTVVGVVPDRTAGWTRPAAIWLPYTAQTYFDPGRDVFHNDEFLWLSLAGRLAPGYTRSRAEAEFNVLSQQGVAGRGARRTAVMTTDGSWMQEMYLTASGRDLMLIGFFLGAFNLVLVIACANVATLLLSRAAVRRREIAVRLSLGAPRIRLVRMLLTESLLLSAIAGAASAWLVWRVPQPLYRTVVNRAPDFPMSPDWETFAYICGVVMCTGILAGLAPAIESVKINLTGSLKGLAPSAFGGARLRGMLVSAQVALSMVLLVEAGLFARSEDQNLRGNPGYEPERVVVMPMRFREGMGAAAAAVRLRAIEDRVKGMPGVRSVAFSERIPMIGEHHTVDLRPPSRPDASQPVDVHTVSPHFLETMGIPLLAGQDLKELDPRSVVISQALGKALWQWRNPLGKTLTLPAAGTVTIVGVARDVEPMRIGGSENPAIYIQGGMGAYENTMSVRVDGNASTASAVLRAATQNAFPDILVLARPLEKWIDEITETLWNVVALIVILGLVATALATSGIYGAVSFAVNQRTRELGIRVALGARRLDIIREVLVSGGKPVVHGLVVGMWLSVAVAAGLKQSVERSPLRLDTSNPLLYVAAVVLLAVTAVLAMLLPAHRGAKADPLDALRCE